MSHYQTDISQLQDRLGFKFQVAILDFFTTFGNRSIDILCLGAFVGANALNELIEVLLKHSRSSSRFRIWLLW
jgi:hypothetical protein